MYTCIALRALKVSYSDAGEGVAVNCEQPVHIGWSMEIVMVFAARLQQCFIVEQRWKFKEKKAIKKKGRAKLRYRPRKKKIAALGQEKKETRSKDLKSCEKN